MSLATIRERLDAAHQEANDERNGLHYNAPVRQARDALACHAAADIADLLSIADMAKQLVADRSVCHANPSRSFQLNMLLKAVEDHP